MKHIKTVKYVPQSQRIKQLDNNNITIGYIVKEVVGAAMLMVGLLMLLILAFVM